MSYIVGLTGGIGTGKSTVADLFAKLGADVIDADKISHDLTAQGQTGFAKIIEAFGDEYLEKSGNLDRTKLRETIFNNPQQRKKLESLLHPLIDAELNKLIEESNGPYILLMIPLLLETGNYRDLVNRILVIDCDEQQQIDRVMQRSNLNATQIKNIIAAQMPRSERLKHADDVIINNKDLNHLQKQVTTLHNAYLEQSQ
jgi:dephospho-CoA kinase